MSTRKSHILIIDDDQEITHLINDYLIKNGFRTTWTLNGLNIKQLLREHNFDLIILDIMLPGIDGLHLCQMIRQTHSMPIIMLSAANSIADKVAGLELGADDYISKPFSSRELLARVKAQLRRTQGELEIDRKNLPRYNKYISIIGFLIATHSLIDKDSVAIPLSHREYELLIIFRTSWTYFKP